MDWALFIKDSEGFDWFISCFDNKYAAEAAARNLRDAGIPALIERY